MGRRALGSAPPALGARSRQTENTVPPSRPRGSRPRGVSQGPKPTPCDTFETFDTLTPWGFERVSGCQRFQRCHRVSTFDFFPTAQPPTESTVAGSFRSVSAWILRVSGRSKTVPLMSNSAAPPPQGLPGLVISGPGASYLLESFRPTHAVTRSAGSPFPGSTSPRNLDPAGWTQTRMPLRGRHQPTAPPPTPPAQSRVSRKKKDSRTKSRFSVRSAQSRVSRKKKERFSRESKIPVFRPVSLIRWLPLSGGALVSPTGQGAAGCGRSLSFAAGCGCRPVRCPALTAGILARSHLCACALVRRSKSLRFRCGNRLGDTLGRRHSSARNFR